jgi:4-hydroxy-tetrahydrodipicolinate reductase
MTSEPIAVCLAGATGWAGSELARAIASSSDVVLVAAVSRTHAGRRLGEVLGDARITCPIYSSAVEALSSRCDVFVEYTKPDSAKANALAAVEHGAHVVVGTSGLTEQDYAEDRYRRAAARTRRLGRRQLRSDCRADAEVCRDGCQTDSAMESHRLRARRQESTHPAVRPVTSLRGCRGSTRRNSRFRSSRQQASQRRAATLAGAQVHSVRLPGFVTSAEVISG